MSGLVVIRICDSERICICHPERQRRIFTMLHIITARKNNLLLEELRIAI
jgi:hypothetical protein